MRPRSGAFLEQDRAAASRAEDIQAAPVGSQPSVCAPGSVAIVSSGWSRSLSKLQTTTGVADRHVQAPEVGVVHEDVRFAGKRQAREHLAVRRSRTTSDAAVGRTEEPVGVEPEPVRALAGTGNARSIASLLAVDDDDLGRLADVGVDTVALLVVDAPSAAVRAAAARRRRCIASRSTTEALQFSPSGSPRLNAYRRRRRRS